MYEKYHLNKVYGLESSNTQRGRAGAESKQKKGARSKKNRTNRKLDTTESEAEDGELEGGRDNETWELLTNEGSSLSCCPSRSNNKESSPYCCYEASNTCVRRFKTLCFAASILLNLVLGIYLIIRNRHPETVIYKQKHLSNATSTTNTKGNDLLVSIIDPSSDESPPLHQEALEKSDLAALSERKSYKTSSQATNNLHDITIRLNPDIVHPWLSMPLSKEKPKARLLLTDFGWNNPDTSIGISTPRSGRMRELLDAFVNHPYFDPSFQWSIDSEDESQFNYYGDNEVHNIVMLDLETCFELNYPHYSGKSNFDYEGGRREYTIADWQSGRRREDFYWCEVWGDCQKYVDSVLGSRLFQQHRASTVLFIDCLGTLSWNGRYPNGNLTHLRQVDEPSHQLSWVALTQNSSVLRDDSDMGLPPKAINGVHLTAEEEASIQTCQSEENRKYLLTFLGNIHKKVGDNGGLRQGLLALNNYEDVITLQPDFFKKVFKHLNYRDVAKSSLFAAAPRGDDLFSYRFTEVLSAGAIPVVYADGWVYPFRKEVFDWSECAVIIPQREVSNTLATLQQLSDDQRCKMRQRCYEIYKKYMATPAGNIEGIVESVLAMNKNRTVT